MKYRVIKCTEADGQTWYYPQYKKFFLWWFFERVSAPVCRAKMGDFDKTTKFDSAEAAFAFIDEKPLQNIVVKKRKSMKYINKETGESLDGLLWDGKNYAELFAFLARHEEEISYFMVQFKGCSLRSKCVEDIQESYFTLVGSGFFFFRGGTLRWMDISRVILDPLANESTEINFNCEKEIKPSSIVINANDEKKIIINL